ncbi:MAG: MltA domain-containing protein, partial [Alphaproteobacteria bacterium]
CAKPDRVPPGEPRPEAPPSLAPVGWSDLPGWGASDAAPALAAFKGVCKRFQRKPADEPVSKAWPELGSAGAWSDACASASSVAPARAQAFVEANFRPFRVGAESDRGLFTGYFEPEIPGARRKGGPYQTPLYVKPKDIVVADLGAFSDDLAGKTLIGKVRDGRFEPYDDRAAIAAGSLAGRGLELVWLADPIDGFFLEIQGSGRIRLAGGGAMRVGYAGKNGRAYRAIGCDLIERGAIRREDMSMQAIRSWLTANPGEAREVMNLNRSVVFFIERTGPGPVGAAGTALTPGASLAVDPDFVALGSLLYLDAPHPEAGAPPIRRLVVAEDTGGAIKGANRGDLFWGTGPAAGEFAGRMASRGRYYLLAPLGG